jgi:peptide/nickel transport system substrate-binding protein
MRRRTGHWVRVAVAGLAFAVVAAACGDSDPDADGDDASSTTAVTDGSTTGSDVTTGGGSGEDPTPTGVEATHGGKLVYGIEADTANPWPHYSANCAISCRMILRSITDPLFVTDSAGDIVPYLVETVEPSADYTTWTMTIRDGIFFHDGTPLDGAAVKYNIDTCRFSQLQAPAFLGIADVAADGQTVTLTYEQPDALGPRVLRAEICGLMLSPAWLASLANNPLNNEPFVTEAQQESLDLSGNQLAPVGLGPFVYADYSPGNGNSFTATRNPDYWRGDGPSSLTGEGLPYLDEVEFVVAVDAQGRANGLRGGQFDIIHTSDPNQIVTFVGDDDFKLRQATDFGETSYTLINVARGTNPTLAFLRSVDEVAMDPLGLNAANPLVHLSCRRALAHARDQQRLADEQWAGLAQIANGPFPPGSIGYLPDTGYPQFDLDAAATAWEQCKTDVGEVPVTFAFDTTNDPGNLETNDLEVAMWKDAFGDEIEVTVSPIEQGQFIELALVGMFDSLAWRNHAGVDPAEQWYWWSSATANPIDPGVPELALNFGRFQDPAMDAQLATIRHNPDPAQRQAAAEAVNRLFGENVWNFWTVWTLWAVISTERVQNLTNLEIPGTDSTVFPIVGGKHFLTQVWCLDGNCQG